MSFRVRSSLNFKWIFYSNLGKNRHKASPLYGFLNEFSNWNLMKIFYCRCHTCRVFHLCELIDVFLIWSYQGIVCCSLPLDRWTYVLHVSFDVFGKNLSLWRFLRNHRWGICIFYFLDSIQNHSNDDPKPY